MENIEGYELEWGEVSHRSETIQKGIIKYINRLEYKANGSPMQIHLTSINKPKTISFMIERVKEVFESGYMRTLYDVDRLIEGGKRHGR